MENHFPHSSHLAPLTSLLVANRGEIASRIIRTCKQMGIQSIAVYSEADRNAPFVREADIAFYLGGSEPADSYLNRDKLFQACEALGADAIHPGYGFLAENAAFARACAARGILFVGPHAEAIEAMGSKAAAKAQMAAAGIPIIPGYQGKEQGVKRFKAEAERIGFPVLLKASAGGGGKGMRIVDRMEDLEGEYHAAKREAAHAFGEDTLIVEKYIARGRHIEFQVFGDKMGNIIHLFERECSIQRRHQKIVEESPSAILTEAKRSEMGHAAIAAASAIQYDNAGTVEFIYEEGTGQFYFLEVNTRLQVEHPVTEAITGLDLVRWQIDVARGKALPLTQDEVSTQGYAMEVRLYAEDPAKGFLPATGTVLEFEVPNLEGFRIETAVEKGTHISHYYDPMIAKLIVWDRNRADTLRKMGYILKQLRCPGLKTNQALLQHLFSLPNFLEGAYSTHFLEEQGLLTFAPNRPQVQRDLFLIAATLYDWHLRDRQRSLLRSLPSGWRNNFYQGQKCTYQIEQAAVEVTYCCHSPSFSFHIEEESYEIRLVQSGGSGLHIEEGNIRHPFTCTEGGHSLFLHHPEWGMIQVNREPRFPEKSSRKEPGHYLASMPSQVVHVLVQEGDEVAAGDRMVILSSMKMENVIRASEAGKITSVWVQEGQNIEAGTVLVQLTPNET